MCKIELCSIFARLRAANDVRRARGRDQFESRSARGGVQGGTACGHAAVRRATLTSENPPPDAPPYRASPSMTVESLSGRQIGTRMKRSAARARQLSRESANNSARGAVHSDSQCIAAVDGRVERSNRPPREPQLAA